MIQSQPLSVAEDLRRLKYRHHLTLTAQPIQLLMAHTVLSLISERALSWTHT